MRVLFMGTPVFAIPSLMALTRHGHELVGVVTQPARAQQRGQKVKLPSPVAIVARSFKVPILEPEKLNTPFVSQVRQLNPEVIAVAAYGRILPDDLLGIPPQGCWNVHPSLLPRWRGPAPIHRAIQAGDEETGVTIMRVGKKVDSGEVALQERTAIGPRETRGELEGRLAHFGAALLTDTLYALSTGTLKTAPQDDSAAVYAGVFAAREAEIDWKKPAEELDRLVRALDPSPGAYFKSGRFRIKVRAVQPVSQEHESEPGILLERIPQGAWRVACGNGSLWIGSVKPEGRSWMSMDAYLAGKRLKAGKPVA